MSAAQRPAMSGFAWGLLVVLGAVVLLVAADAPFWPLGFDQGAFAWVGDVIAQGGVPYRDAWELKGPAVYYTYAASQLLLGRSSWGIRVTDLAILCVGLVVLWRFVARASEAFGAWASVLVLSSLYLSLGWWNTAQPDGWASLLVLMALACLWRGPASTPRAVVAGVLIGCAALFKPPYGAFALSLLPLQLAAPARAPAQRLQAIATMLVAAAVVLALAGAGLAMGGALAPFLEIQLQFNPTVYRADSAGSWLTRAAALRSRLPLLPLLPLAVLGAVGSWRVDRALVLAVGTSFGIAAAILVIQDKYFAYQWMPLYVPFAVLVGLGCAELRRRLARSSGARRLEGWLPAAAFALLLLPILPLPLLGGWRAFVFHTLPREDYIAGFVAGPAGNYSPAQHLELAAYLASHTKPEQRVVVWGMAPEVHFLSGRGTPSRFGFHYPLVAGPEGPFYQRYREEFLRDLSAAPPAYFVVADRDENSLIPRTSRQHLREFPRLRVFLRRHYLPEGQVGDFTVFRRRAGTS